MSCLNKFDLGFFLLYLHDLRFKEREKEKGCSWSEYDISKGLDIVYISDPGKKDHERYSCFKYW